MNRGGGGFALNFEVKGGSMSIAAIHQHWSSRFAFIMATVGAAVGLGNFWRFPYQAGENGGGAFVIIYIGVVLVIAIPLIMTELLIGRRGQLSAVGSSAAVGREQGGTALWGLIGWLGMIASYLILTFYSVVAGWVMAYIPLAVTPGSFSGGADAVGQIFGDMLGNWKMMIFWHTLFMLITCLIVVRGLHKGIEFAANVLMPAFFVMLLFVVGYSYLEGDFASAASYLFVPDWSEVTVNTFMDAIGQAFFSVSVATAILITYGGYLERGSHLVRSSYIVSAADTGVALLAGVAIFPLVFMYGADPAGGPGLLFVTLPLAFAELPQSQLFGTVFFTLALFAALTSSIALLEIIISWAEEQGFSRPKAVLIFGGGAWVLGVGSALSFADAVAWVRLPDGILPGIGDRNFYGLIDFLTANLMLPLGGFLIAIFGGWVLSREVAMEEFGISGWQFKVWRLLVRYLIPLALGAVLILSTLENGFGIDLLAGASGG